MATLTPSIANGKPFFTGTSSFRSKDDAADKMVLGVYEHNALDFSATEAAEWLSFFLFLADLLKSGGPALAVINKTGGNLAAATPVRIGGFDTTSGKLKIVAAAADTAAEAAHYVLRDAIADNASGVVYKGGALTTTLNTSGAAVGDPVYLKDGGGISLSAGTVSQIVGYVKTLAVAGEVVFHVAN